MRAVVPKVLETWLQETIAQNRTNINSVSLTNFDFSTDDTTLNFMFELCFYL